MKYFIRQYEVQQRILVYILIAEPVDKQGWVSITARIE